METTEHLIERKKEGKKNSSILVSGFPVLYWNFREEIDLTKLVAGYISSNIPSNPLNSWHFSRSFKKSISLWELYLFNFIALI